MLYEVNSGGMNVIFETVDLNVIVGDAARIDVGEAINYIKSGQAEINNYVETVSKPSINNYVDNTAKPAIDSYVNNTSKPSIDAYVTNTIEPQLDDYVDLAKDWATKTDGTVDGSEYSAKYYAEQAQTTLSSKQDILTEDNAGTGISITGSGANVLISSTQTSAEWGNIRGNLPDQTDLQDALSAKVNKAGDTMTGILKIKRSSGNEFLQIYPSVLLDEPPSTTRNIAMFVNYDTTGKVMAKALQNLGSDGSNTIKLTAWKPWTGQNAGIETGWDARGIAFATAPETSTTRTNYTDIITRGYLNTYKQDMLVSGTNIKTINNNSLLGSGNIDLTASDVGALANTTTINDLTTTAQQNALNSGATTANIGQIATNASDISLINDKIPAQASTSNQLADKDFVNSSIATNTANFIGTFNSVAELEAYSGTLTNNDYAFVSTTDTAGNTLYDRYKWNGSEWLFEYELNNSSFTAVQWAAINSGATTAVVELAQSALQPSDNISELNNDAGYITGISSSDVTSALGYTPQDTLVSGTNIKTINNQSILGSGNIDIQGGSDVEAFTAAEVQTIWNGVL